MIVIREVWGKLWYLHRTDIVDGEIYETWRHVHDQFKS